MMNGFLQVTKRQTKGLVRGLKARLRIQSGSRIIQLPILKDNFEFCNATDYGDCYVLSSALIGDTNSVNKYSASIEYYYGFVVPLNGSVFYP